MNSVLKYIMKVVRTVAFSLIFLLGLNKASLACNLLGINIGGDKSEIEKLIVTDTIDNHDKIKKASNIEVLTISNLMGEAIKRISNSTSVSDLFK